MNDKDSHSEPPCGTSGAGESCDAGDGADTSGDDDAGDVSAADDAADDADVESAQDADSGAEADTTPDALPEADAAPPACPEGESPTIVAIAGDLAHEAILRIDGCRFGPKEQPEPRLYDTVDNQPAYAGLAVGDRIPTETDDAPWSVNSDTAREYVRFATDDPREHRAAFYRVSGGSHGGDGKLEWPRALGAKNPPADQLLLYVTWWYRPSMSPSGGEPAGSNKFIRVWDDSGGEGTRISWTQMHLTYSGAEYTAWKNWNDDGKVGQWNRMEIIVDAEQGTIRHYVNGVYQQVSFSAVGTFDINDFVKKPDYADVGLNIAALGFDHGSSAYGDMISDFGEIYIDTTRARVEIGDAPTWTETRHREIQIPTAWSENAIEVRLQEGSFDGLNGRYLYVIDAQGNVNEQGFPL